MLNKHDLLLHDRILSNGTVDPALQCFCYEDSSKRLDHAFYQNGAMNGAYSLVEGEHSMRTVWGFFPGSDDVTQRVQAIPLGGRKSEMLITRPVGLKLTNGS